MSEKTVLHGQKGTDKTVSSAEEESPQANRTALWIGLGALVLLLLCGCVLAGLLLTGVFTFRNLSMPALGEGEITTPAVEAVSTVLPSPTAASSATPATPTEAMDEEFLAASRFAGTWEGEWVNQTFGSSGAAHGLVTINQGGVAAFTIDFDGLVFGVVDPPAKSYEGTYSSAGSHFEADSDSLFGDLQIDVDPEGNMTVSGEMVPVEGVASFNAEGMLTEDSLHLDYSVQFPAGGEANGVIDMTRQASSSDSEPITSFLAEFETAMRAGDIEFLLDRLHPAVIERYGEIACTEYITQVAQPTFGVEVVQVYPQQDWVYDQDGVDSSIENAWSADVEVSSGGQLQESTAHYAEVEGTLRWFTDCGDPLPN